MVIENPLLIDNTMIVRFVLESRNYDIWAAKIFAKIWHKNVWMKHPIKIEFTRKSVLV